LVLKSKNIREGTVVSRLDFENDPKDGWELGSLRVSFPFITGISLAFLSGLLEESVETTAWRRDQDGGWAYV
jgi:hypothetical protein